MPGSRRGDDGLAVWVLKVWPLFLLLFLKILLSLWTTWGSPESHTVLTWKGMFQQILFTLPAAGCLSSWTRQPASFPRSVLPFESIAFHQPLIFPCYLQNSPIPCCFLTKPFWSAPWLHMLSWWHLFGNFLFFHLPPPPSWNKCGSLFQSSVMNCFSDLTVISSFPLTCVYFYRSSSSDLKEFII